MAGPCAAPPSLPVSVVLAIVVMRGQRTTLALAALLLVGWAGDAVGGDGDAESGGAGAAYHATAADAAFFYGMDAVSSAAVRRCRLTSA